MICGYKMLGIYRKSEKLFVNDEYYGVFHGAEIIDDSEAIETVNIFSTWEEFSEYAKNNSSMWTESFFKYKYICSHLGNIEQRKFKNAKVEISYTKEDSYSLKYVIENFSHEKAIKYLRQFIEPQNDSAKIIKIKEIKKDELSDFINKTVIDEKPKEKKKFIFQLSDEQQEKYRKWARTHDCVIRNKDGIRYVGAAGGADTFQITSTGLGWIVKVKCSCGSKLDLTEDF